MVTHKAMFLVNSRNRCCRVPFMEFIYICALFSIYFISSYLIDTCFYIKYIGCEFVYNFLYLSHVLIGIIDSFTITYLRLLIIGILC